MQINKKFDKINYKISNKELERRVSKLLIYSGSAYIFLSPLLLNLQSSEGSIILELQTKFVLVHLDFGSKGVFTISSRYTHLKKSLSSLKDHSNTKKTRMRRMVHSKVCKCGVNAPRNKYESYCVRVIAVESLNSMNFMAINDPQPSNYKGEFSDRFLSQIQLTSSPTD